MDQEPSMNAYYIFFADFAKPVGDLLRADWRVGIWDWRTEKWKNQRIGVRNPELERNAGAERWSGQKPGSEDTRHKLEIAGLFNP